MPQMAPLNWLILFFFFTMIYLIFNMLNYFIFQYNIKSSLKIKKQNKINWKW
uniref:ATP synthase complex subunit 8 n=1 Tax=Scarabaeoidea sp. KM-2017 TaxID=2219446 RepID=A0A346RIP6_9SCAR|nr:ATP synthase F0 subunit 8 [Scarabaeoidea sp. KM-2017]